MIFQSANEESCNWDADYCIPGVTLNCHWITYIQKKTSKHDEAGSGVFLVSSDF